MMSEWFIKNYDRLMELIEQKSNWFEVVYQQSPGQELEFRDYYFNTIFGTFVFCSNRV
ncbi:hypothetical protein [Pseudalkalibacillus decolorationis]|uniref:hypothetical protein n=1 Tax=Pseudalkalibacillus decolorationis TaxID=163879 RepID=UPI002147CD4F|nr:hypothetical protein [Pseudalkalibacillus decolorationis]